MNKKLIITFAISIVLLISCGQRKELTYNSYTSVDNVYRVEIPSSATQGRCNMNVMNFENKNSNLIIVIQRISEKSIDEYIRNKDITNNTFTYNLFQFSDTTSFYKITRGSNMWSAYDLYMLKRLDGSNYLVKVSSDVIGQSEMIDMIKHIYLSMKSKDAEEGNVAFVASKDEETFLLEKTYSTPFYSIKYPKQWQVQEHLDEMTEVYIGYQPDNFGFTIVRFETDYTLSEVNAEGNENVRQAGIRILEEKQMKVDGAKCYKAIQEITIQEQKVKHISYTFKKGDMLYNIKFGSVKTKAQENLASNIIDSFHFKQTR